jgi:hypothetical protein
LTAGSIVYLLALWVKAAPQLVPQEVRGHQRQEIGHAERKAGSQVSDIHPLTVIILRMVFGLIAACLLGLVGFLVGWFVSPGGAAISTPILLGAIGVLAGLGGFVAWLNPDVARPVLFLALGIALLGGLAGAWLGFFYGELFQPGRSFEWTSPQAPRLVVTIVGAGVGANILPILFYVYRLWRYREQ